MTDNHDKPAEPSMLPSDDLDADFRRSYPLDFRIFDEKSQPVLLIDEEKADQTLQVEISNHSPREITFNGSNSRGRAAASRLELHFRPGALSFAALKVMQLDDPSQKYWDLGLPQENADHISLPLTCTKSFNLPVGKSVTLTLKNLSAAAAGGSRGSLVVLYFQGLTYAGETEPIQGSRTQHINIAALHGLQRIPLHVGNIGSGTVLNDGHTPNTLGFRVTNIHREDALVLRPRGLDVPGQFILSFEIEAEEESKEWTLAKKSQAEAVEVSVYGSQKDVDIDWDVRQDDEAERPTWYLTPPEGFALAARDHVRVNLTNLVTSLPDGKAYLSLRHENIPGFLDGDFVIEVIKGPVVVRGQKIGIGKPSGGEMLEVHGRIKDETGYVMPQGAIIMWSGGADTIPEGWVLCDGQNGTPDLQDRFVVGAKPKTAGQFGDATVHSHDISPSNRLFSTSDDGIHKHHVPWAWYHNFAEDGGDVTVVDRNTTEPSSWYTTDDGSHHHTVDLNTIKLISHEGEIRPRWYALCFIMKL